MQSDKPLTQEFVISICKNKNPKGECFTIHKYKYRSNKNRGVLFEMKQKGILKQFTCKHDSKHLYYYLPESEKEITG